MKLVKKLFLFLPVLLVTFVAVACSSDEANSSNTLNPTTQATPTTTPTTAPTTTPSSSHKHTYATTWSSDDTKHWHQANCGHDLKEDEAVHDFVVTSTTDATCEAEGTTTYTCSVCNKSVVKVTAAKLTHEYENEPETTETLKEGSAYIYVVETKNTCKLCGKEVVVSSSNVEVHDYHAAVTTEATCVAKGVKTYTCSFCNDTYQENIPLNPNAHVWNEGVTADGATTYTCTLCGETKVTLNAKESVTAEVSAENLVNADEIALKNASIALDDYTKEALSDATSVSVSADVKTTADITASDDVKAAIGDSPVYDFSMSLDGEAVSSFNGKVRVTVPYTLSEGEDPDNIVVWYLSGDEPTSISATYSNGTVSFETNHFSLYTVVKLSAKDACKLFGHNYSVTARKESTCLTNGYVIKVCKRCGDIQKEILELTEHEWDVTEYVDSTTKANGHINYVCNNCDSVKNIIIEKLPEVGNNNLANIINSFVSGNTCVEITSLATEENPASEIKAELKLGTDGNIYLLATAKMEEEGEEAKYYTIMDLTNGKRYLISSYSASLDETNMHFTDAAELKQMVYSVTKLIPAEQANAILTKLFTSLCDVNIANGEIVITPSSEKISSVYSDLTTLKIDELIDKWFGTGSYELAKTLISTLLESKVGDLITNLGIDLDKLPEFIKNMIPVDLNTILTEEVKNTKLIDLLAGSFGYSITTELVVSMADSMLKNATAVDLIKILLPLVSNFIPIDLPELPEMLPTVDELKEMISTKLFKLTLSTDYELKELEVNVKINTSFVNADKIVVKFAQENDIVDIDEITNKTKEALNSFDVSLTNYEWLTNALDAYLDENDNQKLTYTISESNESYYQYTITSSKFETPYSNNLYRTNTSGKTEYVAFDTEKNKFVWVYYDSATNKNVYVEDFKFETSATVYYEINFKINPNVYFEDDSTRTYFINNAKLIIELPDGQIVEKEIDLPYNLCLVDEKYSLISDKNSNVIKDIKIITKEEFLANQKNYTEEDLSDNDDYIFYKVIYDDYANYSYRRNDESGVDLAYEYSDIDPIKTSEIYTNTLHIEYMETGLVSLSQIVIYRTEVKYTYFEEKIYKDISLDMYDLTYLANGLLVDSSYNRQYNISDLILNAEKYQELDLGTFKYELVKKEAKDASLTEITYKVSFDNGTTWEEFTTYVLNHTENPVEGEFTADAEGSCEGYVTYTYSCCNRTFKNSKSNHEWESITLLNPTKTQVGVYEMKCKNCDESHVYTNYCDHPSFDEDDNCTVCGLEKENMDATVVEDLTKEDDEDYKFGYYINYVSSDNQKDYAENEYRIYLGILFDEEGEEDFEIFDKVYFVDEVIEEKTGTLGHYFTFNKDDFATFLENSEYEEYKPVVLIFDIYSTNPITYTF